MKLTTDPRITTIQGYYEGKVNVLEHLSRFIGGPVTLVGLCFVAEHLDPPQSDLAPADVFIMNRGEKPHPNVTMIGGVPTRPKGWPWPEDPSHAPMTFIGQIDFSASIDIAGELPGHLLLIFTSIVGPGEDENGRMSCIYTEWYSLCDTDELMSQDQIPNEASPLPALWGTKYRIFDVKASVELTQDVTRILTRGKMQKDDAAILSETLFPIGGWKIGGFARTSLKGIEQSDAAHLCSVSAFYPSRDIPYPFHDSARPLNFDESYALSLPWWDGFIIDFWMDGAGRVQASIGL